MIPTKEALAWLQIQILEQIRASHSATVEAVRAWASVATTATSDGNTRLGLSMTPGLPQLEGSQPLNPGWREDPRTWSIQRSPSPASYLTSTGSSLTASCWSAGPRLHPGWSDLTPKAMLGSKAVPGSESRRGRTQPLPKGRQPKWPSLREEPANGGRGARRRGSRSGRATARPSSPRLPIRRHVSGLPAG